MTAALPPLDQSQRHGWTGKADRSTSNCNWHHNWQYGHLTTCHGPPGPDAGGEESYEQLRTPDVTQARHWHASFRRSLTHWPARTTVVLKTASMPVLCSRGSPRLAFIKPARWVTPETRCSVWYLSDGSRRAPWRPWIRASATDGRARLIAALQIATDTITVNTAISRRVIVRLDQTLEGKSHVSSFGHQT